MKIWESEECVLSASSLRATGTFEKINADFNKFKTHLSVQCFHCHLEETNLIRAPGSQKSWPGCRAAVRLWWTFLDLSGPRPINLQDLTGRVHRTWPTEFFDVECQVHLGIKVQYIRWTQIMQSMKLTTYDYCLLIVNELSFGGFGKIIVNPQKREQSAGINAARNCVILFWWLLWPLYLHVLNWHLSAIVSEKQ